MKSPNVTPTKKRQFDPKLINCAVFKPSFWDNLPMKRDNLHTNFIINADFEYNGKSKLPRGYKWVTFDAKNDTDLRTVCDFLNQHYKLPQSRIYKPAYLRWLLNPPHKHIDCLPFVHAQRNAQNAQRNAQNATFKNAGLLFGVVYENDTKLDGAHANTDANLVAIMGAHPTVYRIDEQLVQSFYVDFMCVHAKLRRKKLALVLMKHLYKILQASHFHIGILFHTFRHMSFMPIVKSSRILFRPLNIDKLAQTMFSKVGADNIYKLKTLYENIQPTFDLGLIRFANIEDIGKMMDIYEKYNRKIRRLTPILNRKEFEHYFLPKDELIYTYVITNNAGEVKDFASLHAFDTKSGQRNVYLYYISFINEKLLSLFMKNILYIMRSCGFDMIYANNIYGINNVFKDHLHFKALDVLANTYMFNYNSPQVPLEECSLNLFI